MTAQYQANDYRCACMAGSLGKLGVYYLYGSYRIKYVGFQTPLDCIPQGTVLRMSLANWWKKGDSDEERCYLQLSGWYV